ncbi:hypothetical protein KR009_011255 [Drosophila setifemur]|nr:hypothetical protein KR009_011255 [Drosophila setifemur]
MREVNLLTRCTFLLLFFILVVTQICGATTFTYSWRRRRFNQSFVLRIYSGAILALASGITILAMMEILKGHPNRWPYLAGCIVILVTRLKVSFSCDIIRIINNILDVLIHLNSLTRNPNIFRLRHLMFLIFSIQNITRSLSMIMRILFPIILENPKDANLVILALFWFLILLLLQITLNISLFVVLIAIFNQLHRYTRTISNDVNKLRNSPMLDSGQVQVLIKQLQSASQLLINLRSKTFRITMQTIQIFQYPWLCAIIFGLMPFNCFRAIDWKDLYYLAICAGNIIFNCTIFKILSWESRTSRSFCHFHLSNYHQGLDRMIDELLHQEIWEQVKISIYGIALDMKTLLKLLSIGTFLVFVNSQSHLQR